MLNKRTQILFDNDFWSELLVLAKARQMSVGELVRNALRETYFAGNDKQKMAKERAFENILNLKKTIKPISIEKIGQLINYGRKY
ncbi:hypothetical protein COT65_00350 [Candidatus Shapirobacteria bacterium CG09_land_8_20_14_0_10_47_13]|uniref:Ribbon-helix-helix protein CopG domain-containing protein n=1 Tax=Candidatus Shapirobacteria bacterium CG09_land_8_20_14_0_10_47_13 TaxID=1974481 RepID=A0A2H0WND5_9BACT|nr:MAG: hypothetical protein COT65_00350 [Candidatus Shapirobacteria bacterium CG09_land_8_20_14_0_10_47_13]